MKFTVMEEATFSVYCIHKITYPIGRRALKVNLSKASLVIRKIEPSPFLQIRVSR